MKLWKIIFIIMVSDTVLNNLGLSERERAYWSFYPSTISDYDRQNYPYASAAEVTVDEELSYADLNGEHNVITNVYTRPPLWKSIIEDIEHFCKDLLEEVSTPKKLAATSAFVTTVLSSILATGEMLHLADKHLDLELLSQIIHLLQSPPLAF